MRVLLFDTETTGLLQPDNAPLKSQPEIIEFYGVVINEEFAIQSEFSTMIKPVGEISNEITRITGINPGMVKDSPYFHEIWQDLEDIFEDIDLAVAHNIAFDNGMLDVELKRIGRKRPKAKYDLCTVEATMGMKGFRLSLVRLHQMLFNKNFKAHRAKDDVHALVRCFHELTERGVINLELYKN